MPFLFRPNPIGIAAIMRDAKAYETMNGVAQRLQAEAQAIAPVASGAFQDSLHGEVQMGEHGWEAHLVTDSPYWPFLEFGTSDTPMFATLRRTLEGFHI